jgi:hypothetical protein
LAAVFAEAYPTREDIESMKKAIVTFLGLIPTAILILNMFLTSNQSRLETFDGATPNPGIQGLINCPQDNNASDIIHFENGIALTGIQRIPDKVKDKMSLLMSWAIPEKDSNHSYSFALHVIDSRGNLVAQSDYALPDQSFGCVSTQIDVSTLPTGNYALRVAAYSPDTGKRLPSMVLATREQNDSLLLGQFMVAR